MSEGRQWQTRLQTARSPEQNTNWWDDCYIELPVQVTLRGIERSVVVVGDPQSGKTMAINAFERVEQGRLFLVRYPVDRWYGEANAWLVTEDNHLSQIMACAAVEIRNFISRHPDKLDNLTDINLEYLRWLVKKHSSKRTFSRWADSLTFEPLLQLMTEPYEDIYPDATALHDAQGQIEELVTLSRRLGFEGVAVLVDLAETDVKTDSRRSKVADLFSWLIPLQFEGFAIKAAIPKTVVEQTNLLTLPRDRVSFTFLDWRLEDCLQLANKYLAFATDNRLETFSQLVHPDLQTIIVQHLLDLYENMSPQVWMQLLSILLPFVEQDRQLCANDADALLQAYYASYVPLRFDEAAQGVWRGKTFFRLDPQPFGFLQVLWHYRDSLDDPDQELLKLAGGRDKRGNMNTIASRLRNKIEPFPKLPVYIQNNRIRGYWLENTIDADE